MLSRVRSRTDTWVRQAVLRESSTAIRSLASADARRRAPERLESVINLVLLTIQTRLTALDSEL